MHVRLAGGVVPPGDHEIWLPGPLRARAPLTPGTPVAVGPRDADDARVREALGALTDLVAVAGVVAAGADIDLGYGFRSARVDGGHGDRRDALLVVLPSAAHSPVHSSAQPGAILVALFGPAATRRVGAAFLTAVAENRWPAVRYASAVSDLLGPERLEQVLALTAPAGIDPFGPGLPSVIGAHLTRLLGGLSPARRFTLITDLWQRIGADQATRRRLARLRTHQRGSDRTADLLARYRRLDDDVVLALLRADAGREPSLAAAARWTPPASYLEVRAEWHLQDALAATVLGRLAESVFDGVTAAALRRHRPELEAVAALTDPADLRRARQRVGGLIRMPARPVVVVHDLAEWLRTADPRTRKTHSYVATRVVRARDWCEVMHRMTTDLLVDGDTGPWRTRSMAPWRARVGHFAPDRIDGWTFSDGQERASDLFWYAELGDQLARLNGHPAATISWYEGHMPYVDPDPTPHREPLDPRTDSISVAVTGAAQLAELGGTVPLKARDWPAAVAGLRVGAAVAEALTGTFAVPLAGVDGSIVPGTDLRVEVAHDGRQLARWADHMGNCISGGHYTEEARAGRSVLIGLHEPDGRLVLNVELRRHHHRWHVDEFRARFNGDPDPAYDRAVRAWVAELDRPEPAADPPALDPPPTAVRPMRTVARPTPAARLLRDVVPDLRAALTPPAPGVLHELAGFLPSVPHARGPEALIALRRATPATLTTVCRAALHDGMDLYRIWQGSADRPLLRAVTAIGESDRLGPLAADLPLAGALRPVARVPEVRTARTVDLVCVRIRAALGRLLRDGDPVLVTALTRRPAVPVLCALALAVSSWRPYPPDVEVLVRPGRSLVPGHPVSRLGADPWRAARAGAAELGGEPGRHGLVVPAAWLGRGGWPALWARAHR